MSGVCEPQNKRILNRVQVKSINSLKYKMAVRFFIAHSPQSCFIVSRQQCAQCCLHVWLPLVVGSGSYTTAVGVHAVVVTVIGPLYSDRTSI